MNIRRETPKEKAESLIEEFRLKINEYRLSVELAELCAIICVIEIMDLNKGFDKEYWHEVKEEIKKR